MLFWLADPYGQSSNLVKEGLRASQCPPTVSCKDYFNSSNPDGEGDQQIPAMANRILWLLLYLISYSSWNLFWHVV